MDYNVTYRKKDKGLQCIISYKDSLGKWRQKSKQGFKTQKESKDWIEDIVNELEGTIKYIDPDMKNITLDDLFQMFMKHAEIHREAATLNNYDVAYKNMEKIKSKKVTDIRKLDAQECVDEMIKKKISHSTVSTYLSRINVFFGYAISPLRIIKDNPFSNVTVPQSKEAKLKKVKALTEAELNDLLSKIKYKPYYVISLIAATCGLRIGEILGLTWADIDEANSVMNINKQWKVVKRSPKTYGFGTVKSKNSNRIVPIPLNTLKALMQYKRDFPIDISGRIFAYKRTDSVCTNLIKAYKRVGYIISVHDLRHTYASRLVANGVDFKTVAELIGDTVQMVISTYSHFTKDMMNRAKIAVNNIF